MSAVEAQAIDLRSSVKLTRNAKGDTQIEVKVRLGDDPMELDQTSTAAQAIYDELSAKYGVSS